MDSDARNTSPEEAELTALADGSLAPERRAALEQEAAGSPELGAALERQRRAVELLRSVDVHAPLALRERLEVQRARGGQRRRRPLLAGLAASAAAAVVVAVLVVGGGTGPSVVEVASTSEGSAVSGAPAADPERPKLLAIAADGVAFPAWEEKFGWSATGSRVDEVEGRRVVTVFYENDRGREAAYSIVTGEALDEPDGRRAEREGTELVSLTDDGRTVVTWRRDGHTCVLTAAGVPREKLLDLAAWRGQGAISF